MNSEIFNDVKTYLPKYLSDEQRKALFYELTTFPSNIDSRMFSDHMLKESFLLQGDCFRDVTIADYEQKTFKGCKALMVSNSCDVSGENQRLYDSHVSFAPIFDMVKYEKILKSKHDHKKVDEHLESIRTQRVSSFFYLPSHSSLTGEAFARFDCCFSFLFSKSKEKELLSNRLIVLSDYGFYLLLLKLSIHSSRIQEAVQRNAS